MRFLFFIALITLLFSCNNSNSNDPVKQRESLIAGLKELQAALLSKDKNRVQEFFDFPLVDSIISVYIDDEDFKSERKKNNKMVTKEMFIKHFSAIYKYMQMEMLDTLFMNIKPEELKAKDEIEIDNPGATDKKQPCYSRYGLRASGDTATLFFGGDNNPSYIDEDGDDEESDYDGCEYSSE